MSPRVPLVAAALAVAACANPAQRAAQVEAQVDSMMAVYGPACDKLGYKRDEDGWRNCVLHLAERDERRVARNRVRNTCVNDRGSYSCVTFWY